MDRGERVSRDDPGSANGKIILASQLGPGEGLNGLTVSGPRNLQDAVTVGSYCLDGLTDRQRDRHTDRQTERQTDR